MNKNIKTDTRSEMIDSVNNNFKFADNRSYSTQNGKNNIKPAVVYINADTQKLQILKENKSKSGIYR